jgi:CheY-like chemotaxis protein
MKQDKSKKLAATIIWNTSSSLVRYISELDNNGITTEYTISNRKELNRIKKLLPEAGVLFILVELDWEGEGDFAGLKIAKELLEEFGEAKPLNICFVSFASRKFLLQNCSDEVKMMAKEFQMLQLPDIKKEYDFLKYYRERYPFILKNVFNPKFVSGIILHAINKAMPDQSADELKNCLNKIAVYAYTYRESDLRKILNTAMESDDCEELWEAIEEIRDIVIKQSAINGLLPGLATNEKFNVAVIDDTTSDRELLKKTIRDYFRLPEGFEFGNGSVALKKLENEADKNNIRAIFVDLELLDEDGGNQPLQGINIVNALRKEFGSAMQIRLVTSLSSEAIQSLGLGGEKVLYKRRGQYALSEEALHSFFEQLHNDINQSLIEGLDGTDTGLFEKGTGLKRLYHDHVDEVGKMIARINEKILDQKNHFKSVSSVISNKETISVMTLKNKLAVLEVVLTHRAILLQSLAREKDIVKYTKNKRGMRLLYIKYNRLVDLEIMKDIRSKITSAIDLNEMEKNVLNVAGNEPELEKKIKSILSEIKKKPITSIKNFGTTLENRLENLARATGDMAYNNHLLFDKALRAAKDEYFSIDRPANNYYNTKLGFSGLSDEVIEDSQREDGNKNNLKTTCYSYYIKCMDIRDLKLFPHEKMYIQELLYMFE